VSKNIENMENNNIELVVARYNEDLNWLKEEPFNKYNVIVYNKGTNEEFYKSDKIKKIVPLKNVGKCDHTYLYHIINSYDDLANITVFLPGSCNMDNKKERAKIIIRNIESHQETVLIVDKHNKNVKDNYNNFTLSEWTTSYETNKQLNSEKNTKLASIRPFGKWFDNMFSDKNTENLHFSSMVGIMGISRKDIIQHQKSYYEKFLKEVDDHSNPEAGHFIERSWFVIFHPYNNPKLIY
jgi:hypothetical protein